MQDFLELVITWARTTGLRIVIIIIGSFIVVRIFRILIRKSKSKITSLSALEDVERAKRTETLSRIVENTVWVIILIGTALMVIKEIGIDIGPLLAGAGVVGLAIGFGAQSLVKDVISGFFILLENHMNVGDVVQVAGEAGLVEKINLRVTVLRDLEGRVHIIPNGEITTVTNMTKEWSRALLDIGVAYKEDYDEVVAVIEEIAEGLRNDPEFGPLILEPLKVLGLDSFGDSSINIKVMFKTIPIKQWDVAREFRRRIKRVFDERGIEIPFPHRTIYMGEGESSGRLKIESTESHKDV